MDEVKFRGLVITNDKREFTKTFKDEKFTVRIPLPFEKANIVATTARATGGLNINSIRPEDYEYLRMLVTLNATVVEYPSWWTAADKCPDEDLLFELWTFYIDSEKAFQEALKKNIGVKVVEGTK